MSNPEIDPYDDGIALTLDLSRPSTDDDIDEARRLLDEWLSPYDATDTPGYRNCGVDGQPGDRRLVLWADRVADADGPEAAIERARSIAELAKTRLTVTSYRVAGMDGADGEIESRLGTPVLHARPGGDLLAQARAAGLLPTPAGLRPALHWLVLVVLLRLAARLFEAPISYVVSSGVVMAGVVLLTIASRAWCRARERALAGAVAIAASAHIAVALSLPSSELVEWAMRIAVTVLALTWVVSWLARGR